MLLLDDFQGRAACTMVWVLFAAFDIGVTRIFFWDLFFTQHPRFVTLPLTDSGVSLFLVYQFSIALAVIAHVQAATTNPGYVGDFRGGPPVPNAMACCCCDYRWKPPRAHHCLRCRRCIFRMDHHCAWINNCVGAGNQKLFVLFLMYSMWSAYLTFLFLACRIVCCFADMPGNVSSLVSPRQTFCMILILVVASAVSLGAMIHMQDFLREQITGIQTNCTVVESYVGTRGEDAPFRDQLSRVFGESPWTWLVPFAPTLVINYAEQIHCWDDRPQPCKLSSDACEYLGIASADAEVQMEPSEDIPMSPPGTNGIPDSLSTTSRTESSRSVSCSRERTSTPRSRTRSSRDHARVAKH
eukprot:TRINITY_DN17142_c0_g1_i1.p1 TRINITY_DN17142_c0_g1~~TRINITY_DN17142_c0_g1_i1.p1  ORF type:complete len:355 (+),score=21.19 TRINITY_DN17142_c0_g1_i1:139-1203(+)